MLVNKKINYRITLIAIKRDASIYLLHTVFIFIILFLHHWGYTENYFKLVSKYNFILFLQKLSVGGFFFLSGYKMAKYKLADPVKNFIVNRFFRIYILYVISLVLFSFTAYPHLNNGDLPSIKNFLVHILCFQSILPDLFQKNYHL